MNVPSSITFDAGDKVKSVASNGNFWLRLTGKSGEYFTVWFTSRESVAEFESALRVLDLEMIAYEERKSGRTETCDDTAHAR